MHARHRSPGNGYRANSMGVPFAASRISPDTSARGHTFYNSEYRPFNNRGFGRAQGRPKSFQQPPPPPPTKADILMEAGRLAAEYLVSKGLLPQSALTAKWQNGSFKKQADDYQDFGQQEDISQQGRTSAHARLGSGPSNAGFSRRRYPDDFNSRNQVKGRRREYYRSNSSDWGREYGRSGSWSDRNRVPTDTDVEDDTGSGLLEEQQLGNDDTDGLQKPAAAGLVPGSEEAADIELVQDKYSNSDEVGSKASAYNAEEDDDDGEPSKGSDLTNLNVENEEMKESNSDYENEKQTVPEDLPTKRCTLEVSTNNGSDLLTLCRFAKFPTKTRSALTSKGSKAHLVLSNAEDCASDDGPPKVAEVLVQDGSDDVSTADALSNTVNSDCPDSDISKVLPDQPALDEGEFVTGYGAMEGKCFRSQSFPDRAFMHDNEEESNLGMPSFGRSTSVKERGEKRAAEDSEMNEASKKTREWLPSLLTKVDEHLRVSNFSENGASSQDERASSDEQLNRVGTKDRLISSCQFPKDGSGSCAKYAQEKQLFPSSFKICDLNLMEASDVNDNHRCDPVLVYPSLAETGKPAAQVDVDLSISNNMSSEYARRLNDGKEIEVIDLEKDTTCGDAAFDNSHRKMESSFTSTEAFPNRTQNAGEMADVQDLMISELFTNFSSCASVPDDMNPLQCEGTLGDDDSIYMSLGEIPLSFIPAWEQTAPQEYKKPF